MNACWKWLVGMLCGFGLDLTSYTAEHVLPLRTNDVVALIGGAAWIAEERDGFVETALRQSLPTHHLRVRNFGREGDTVSSQLRDVNYPSWPALLQQHQVTVVVLQFGQTESFAGESAVARFRQDYASLLDALRPFTPRIILTTPPPFESPPPPLPQLSTRNPQLALYAAAIRELAAARDLPVIELFSALRQNGGLDHTTDGRQLSAQGLMSVAATLARTLAPGSSSTLDHHWFAQPRVESFRQQVAAKNQLWRHYARPTNWAFLAGDRTEQASSRDHRDRSIRWFPGEVEEFGRLHAEAERQLDLLPISNR